MVDTIQYSMFPLVTAHGGELGMGKRKGARPLATKRAMHVVFRARRSVMHRHAGAILLLRRELEKRNQITTYEYSNNDNHLHLLLRGKTREGLRNFFRVFAGQVAQRIGDGKLWLVPVFTRIVAWGKAFAVAKAYVQQNHRESTGEAPYKHRKNRRGHGRPLGPPGARVSQPGKGVRTNRGAQRPAGGRIPWR